MSVHRDHIQDSVECGTPCYMKDILVEGGVEKYLNLLDSDIQLLDTWLAGVDNGRTISMASRANSPQPSVVKDSLLNCEDAAAKSPPGEPPGSPSGSTVSGVEPLPPDSPDSSTATSPKKQLFKTQEREEEDPWRDRSNRAKRIKWWDRVKKGLQEYRKLVAEEIRTKSGFYNEDSTMRLWCPRCLTKFSSFPARQGHMLHKGDRAEGGKACTYVKFKDYMSKYNDDKLQELARFLLSSNVSKPEKKARVLEIRSNMNRR